FLLAGFLAGIGGAMYAHGLSRLTYASFPTVTSINIAVMVVIGGLGIMSGPLLGAMFVLGIPAFVPLDQAGIAATSFGQLLIILYLPGGLAQIVEPIRNRVVRLIGRRAGVDVDRAYAAATPTGERAVGEMATEVRQLPFTPPRRRPTGTLL